MAYQPTHPHPYLESIDATNPLEKVFSVVINPKDVITGYDFSICDVDGDNDEPYEVTKTLKEVEYLYGSEIGTNLVVEVPDEFEMINGKNYQWKITLYDANGASVESPLFYFSAKAMPVITLDVDKKITSCEHTFTATYSQEQKETYMYYQYALYEDGVLVDETAEKIDSLLSYTYSGFISGKKYRVDLTIATSDRKTYKVSRIFDVQYEMQTSPVDTEVTQILDKNCVLVDYSQNLFIKGNTDAEITHGIFGEDSDNIAYAEIPNNKSIYYHRINETKPLSLGEDFTAYYSVHFDDLFAGDIICLTDENTGEEYRVSYDGKHFRYKIGYRDWAQINPYVDENGYHMREKVVQEKGAQLNTNALYILEDEDVIYDDSIIMYNDITANFWWTIVLLPDTVLVYKGKKYSEGGVS